MEWCQPTAPIKYFFFFLGVRLIGNNWVGVSILQSVALCTNYLHQRARRAARSAVPAVPNNLLVVTEYLLPVGTCLLRAAHRVELCHVMSHHRWDVTRCNLTQCSASTAADQNSGKTEQSWLSRAVKYSPWTCRCSNFPISLAICR